MEPTQRAKLLLEAVLQAITYEPSKTRVEITSNMNGVVIKAYAEWGDVGRIIGIQGVNALAIRDLLHTVPGMNRFYFTVEKN